MLQTTPTLFLFNETVNAREAEVRGDVTARLLLSVATKVRNVFGGKKDSDEDEMVLAA